MYRSLWIGPLIIILSLCLRVEARELTSIHVTNEQGVQQRLGSILTGDTLLLLGFFGCEHLCNYTLKEVEQKLSSFRVRPQLVFLSVDEKEGTAEARELRSKLSPDSRWKLVTATTEQIKDIAQVLNFSYRRDPATESIVHENALYFFQDGVLEKKLTSHELEENKLYASGLRGMFYDYKQFCSEFDPRNSKYGPLIVTGVSAFSGIFVIAYGMLFLRLRKKRK